MSAGDGTSSDQADAAGMTGDELLDSLVRLGEGLPFNRHMGTSVRAVGDGEATTVLAASDALTNHLGGVHAIAELAPVELAGALAASSRLRPLLERGFVPVVGELAVRYVAPADGELLAHARVGPEVLAPALAAADAGDKPRAVVDVEVVDADDATVAEARLTFVYLDLSEVAVSDDPD